MNYTKELTDRAGELQKDCHALVNMLDSKDLIVQDGTNVWLFAKLAEIELKIEVLNEKINQSCI
jgi:hypothetical protein